MRVTGNSKPLWWMVALLLISAAVLAPAQCTRCGSGLTVSPHSLSFPPQLVGTNSVAMTITLRSVGIFPVTFNGIVSNGPPFSETNNCPPSLPRNAICHIRVTFAPTAIGTFNGAITISDNAGKQVVTLFGTGVAGGVGISETPSLDEQPLLHSLLSSAQAQLVLYDNFNRSHINPAKWAGTGSDQYLRETERVLVSAADESKGRQLRLGGRAYSDTNADSGGIGGIFGLAIARSVAINQIAFTVQVKSAVAVSCSTNGSQEALAGAEFRGRFFNTEKSLPTSSLGDVETVISRTRHSSLGAQLHVEGLFQRCDDEFCGARTTLGFTDLGTIRVGQPALLHLKWDQPNHQFIFQLNGETSVALPYTVSDSTPPFLPGKNIDLAHVVPNCTSSSRPFVSMEALFDDVYVNR